MSPTTAHRLAAPGPRTMPVAEAHLDAFRAYYYAQRRAGESQDVAYSRAVTRATAAAPWGWSPARPDVADTATAARLTARAEVEHALRAVGRMP